MSVVFVNPPIRLPRAFAHYPTFSQLGTLSNAAWLRSKGHPVAVVDAFSLDAGLNLRDDGDDFRHVGAEIDHLVRAVEAAAQTLPEPVILVVAITMFSDMNRARENLVGPVVEGLRARFPDRSLGLADLFIGGMNYFPYDPTEALERMAGADWILIGEAEPTLPDLVERLGAQSDLTGVPSLAYRHGGRVQFDPASPTPIEPLDALPPPAFDLLNMENFFSSQADAIRKDLVHEYHVVERQLPLMTSRNCPFRCNFCTNQALDLPWRAHTVEHFVGLMTRLRLEYGVDRFLFLDDNINVDKSRFRELVRALAETAVPWDAVNGFRADQLDREMIRAIRSAGNTKITVSAESGDPELLKTVIRKGLKLSSVIEVARLCQEEKIPLQVHYVVGIPGETKTQINKTLEFASMLFEKHGAWPLLQHAIPFPGTQLFADCEANGCFVRPPFDISGSVLEVESIIRTDAFEPQEVVRMKRNGQHLHAATQALTFLDIGGGCDNDCLACTCTPGARESPARSATELYEDLERARFLGARELFIGGGEPTRRTDLPAIVERARELGFERVGLLTNAHGLSDRPAAEHLLAGVDRLVVVLHAGTAAVHDTVAGRAGSYVETMAGIRNASTAGVAHLEIHAAVTTDNLTSLPGLVDLARMVKAQGVTLQVPPPDSPAFARGCVAPWDRAEPWVVAAAKRAQRGFVEVQGVPLCLLRAPAGLARPSPPWLLQRTRPAKSKHPVCKECVAFILCGGFYRPEHDAQYAMIPAASLAT